MIQFKNELVTIFFASVVLGLPSGLFAQAPNAAFVPSESAAADAPAESNEKELLQAVLETREDIRALRHEVESLRKLLESAQGESGSSRPKVEEKFAVKGTHPALADGVYYFNAPWCGPCKIMQPIITRLQREGLPIRMVNVDQSPRNGFDIDSIPTFILLIGHQEKERKKGLLNEGEVREFLAKVPKSGQTPSTSKAAQREVWIAKEELHNVAASAPAERPLIRSVKYLGASEIKPEKLAEETGLKVGTPYEVSTNQQVAWALKSFYNDNGYVEATVELVSGDKPEQRDIVFRIHEGHLQKVVWRYFVGNTSVSGERLAMELKTTPANASFLGKFDPANLAADVVAVRTYYKKLGFFDATITPTLESSKNHKWLCVCYTVQEGLHYRIRNLSVIGNTRLKTDELLGAIKTRNGQFYNAFTIKEDIEAIKKKYDRTSFRSAKVEVTSQFLEQRGVIDLVLRIDEGKPYEPRAYPVADLVVPIPGGPKTDFRENFKKLISLLTDTIAPKTWDKAGGGGSISYYDKTFSLIIRQTPEVHRQVSAFIRSLRSLQDWQVCSQLTLIENPAADLLQSIGTAGFPEGSNRVLPLSDEQRTKLLDAASRKSDSKVLSQTVTMFYGTHGPIGWYPEPKENETVDLELADSTDRYTVNLRFGLHDSKTGKATAEPVAVSVGNSKTVVIELKPTGAGASARPLLLVVRPRLLFPVEEEESRQ